MARALDLEILGAELIEAVSRRRQAQATRSNLALIPVVVRQRDLWNVHFVGRVEGTVSNRALDARLRGLESVFGVLLVARHLQLCCRSAHSGDGQQRQDDE